MIDEEEYLISYANLKSGLFNFQKDFISEIQIKNFYNMPYYGIPQCLPKGIKYFDYTKAKFFKIDKKTFSKKIFRTSNLKYIGNSKFFRYGSIFASNVLLKKKYFKKFLYYKKNILYTQKKIKTLNKKYKNICSMQIRNAPHYGHEAVFKHILNKFDFLVLNPIFGIKKKNDFSDLFITKALRYMGKKYDRLKFFPIYSNFYYGGPREALHHLIIRQNLGFNNFYIGRDHAGAEGIYQKLAAVKESEKYKKNFIINSTTTEGGYYCPKCKNYLIKRSCKHRRFINISGTEFRDCLKNNLLYIHADNNLQTLLKKS